MNDRGRILKSNTWISLMIAMFAVVAIGCGTAISSAPVASVSPEPTASAQQASSPAPTPEDADPAAAATDGGLDEACVERVLGRVATGFSDVTAAERDAIFQECSGSEEEQLTRQFTGGRGGDFLDAIDVECLAGITGSEEFDLAELTLEDRQRVFSECVPEDFDRAQGGRGGFNARAGAFAGLGELLEGCVTDALGETPENIFGLDPEQFAAIAEACGDELPEGFGDFSGFGADGADGFGGFGGRGGAGGDGAGGFGGFGGRGGAGGGGGGFRGIDFSSTCVSDAVGRPVEGPQDLTPDDFQKILASCA